MRPLPSSCVRIGYEERKGVLLCLVEDVILSVADTMAVVADTAGVVKKEEAVRHFA